MIIKIKQWIGQAVAFLDRVLEILRVKLGFFKPLSPAYSPKEWIYINGACCLSTSMFFLLGMLHDKTRGFQFAEIYYIPFNMIVCLIWFVEASLWMIFDEEEPAWHKIGELVLSTFFILDGVIWLYEWAFEDIQLRRRQILIYTSMDFLIYLFYLVLAVRAQAKAERKVNELLTGQTVQGDEEAGDEPPSDQKEAKSDFKLMT